MANLISALTTDLGGSHMLAGARVALAFLFVLVSAGSVMAGPERGDSSVFATVPDPGNPEESVVHDGILYVGTTIGGDGLVAGDGKPSKIFGFDLATGELEEEITVEGEDVNSLHGIAGIAVDREGNLYAASTQQGILRFDAKTREQTVYAPLPDLPPCSPLVTDNCSPTPEDRSSLGNGIVFDERGNLFVSDSFQSVIFKIPPHGEAEVWYSDARLHGVFGPNGIKFSPDRKYLYLAVTGDLKHEGFVFRLPTKGAPTAADLELVHAFADAEPDGLAFGKSGRLYVVLGTGGLAVFDKSGELEEVLTSPHFFNPSSLSFDERGNALITNHAFFDFDPAHQTIVKMYVDDKASKLEKPKL